MDSHIITFHFVNYDQYSSLNCQKIQNNLNKQIITIAESSVPWSDLTFS